jgi:hypothetical protein
MIFCGFVDYNAINLLPIPPEDLLNQSTCFPPQLDFDVMIFPLDEDSFLHTALQLVSQLCQLHYYTVCSDYFPPFPMELISAFQTG